MSKGIDISQHNGNIDFSKVAKEVDFVIIRSSWGFYQEDSKFREYANNCEKYKIPYGFYHYSYARNLDEAKKEANGMVSSIQGYHPTFPIIIDMEDADGWKAKNGNPTNDMYIKICDLFCKTLEENGYYAMIYANKDWFVNRINSNSLDRYDKWLAQWTKSPSYNKSFGIWQYTDKGNVNGINGNVDMNIAYKDYPTIIKNKGLNKIKKGTDESITSDKYYINLKPNADDYSIYSLNVLPKRKYRKGSLNPKKYGETLFERVGKVGYEQVKNSFSTMYNEIVNYLMNKYPNKTIVLDGSQLRFINDVNMIKGEVVALRPSIQTCVNQSLNRMLSKNPSASVEEIENYKKKRFEILHQLNPLMNELLNKIDSLPSFNNVNKEFDNNAIENYLNNQAQTYLSMIEQEYGKYFSQEQQEFLHQLKNKKCVKIEKNGDEYLKNQQEGINNDNTLSSFEKIEALRNLNTPLAHGGRVYSDDVIHFYPARLLSDSNKTMNEILKECDLVLMHELLHFFIRPNDLDISSNFSLKGINDYTTEGLVDMCTRDIQNKFRIHQDYNSEYGSNVIFVREMLSNVSQIDDRMRLVFNGSIDEIYKITSINGDDSYKEYIASRDKVTKFDKIISNISHICCSNKKDINRLTKQQYNLAANFENKATGLRECAKVCSMYFKDKAELINEQVVLYSGADNNKGFDIRSNKEIEVADMIKEKNKMIIKEKERVKGNGKVLVKVKTSGGYVSALVLSLLSGVTIGVIATITYFITR